LQALKSDPERGKNCVCGHGLKKKEKEVRLLLSIFDASMRKKGGAKIGLHQVERKEKGEVFLF